MKATSLTIYIENMSFGGQRNVANIPDYAYHEAYKQAIAKVKNLMASEATAGHHEMMYPVGDDGYCTFTARWEMK